MAIIYRANGKVEHIQPKNGKRFKLKELQEIIGGFIQCIHLSNKKVLVVDEDGKYKRLPRNKKATKFYNSTVVYEDEVVGDVLVCEPIEIR